MISHVGVAMVRVINLFPAQHDSFALTAGTLAMLLDIAHIFAAENVMSLGMLIITALVGKFGSRRGRYSHQEIQSLL